MLSSFIKHIQCNSSAVIRSGRRTEDDEGSAKAETAPLFLRRSATRAIAFHPAILQECDSQLAHETRDRQSLTPFRRRCKVEICRT